REPSWGVRGAWLAAGCVLATLVWPVTRTSCTRADPGQVSCVVSRHAMAAVPYSWTRLAPVTGAESEFSPGGVDRTRRGRPILLSESVVRIFDVRGPFE